MSEKAVRKVLRDFGLTEKEADIYIFISKHGILKGGEVAKQTKTPKALVYRILKSLQAKGIVESTLEYPARFVPVPFEDVIDLNVKSKLSEVLWLKDKKSALLTQWRQIDTPSAALPVEKFSVIEGKRKVYYKMAQMVMQTKTMLSSIITAKDLAQANYSGMFDKELTNLSSKAAFRFLIEVSDQNLDVTKRILNEIERRIPIIQVRTPEVGIAIFPQMTIRDNEEAIFYITPKEQRSEKDGDLCLWTNCKSLIEAFSAIFEDLYKNSISVTTKLNPNPASTMFTQKMEVIDDSETALKMYREALHSSEKEIIVVSSCENPSEIGRTKQLLNDLVHKSVNVKLMLPITNDNKAIAWELSKQYAVRHVPLGYLATTLIDGKYLFQFKTPLCESGFSFQKAFYTNDADYVTKNKKMLTDIWEHAQVPSFTTLKSILQEVDPQFSPFPRCPPNSYGAPFIVEEVPPGSLTEKDVLEKMISAKKHPADTRRGIIDWRYGSIGLAVIHPPPHLKVPNLMLFVNKIEKQSRLGQEDAIIFLSWLQTPKGFAYIPVAIIGDNPRSHDFWKTMNAGNPAGQNTHLLKKEEIEIYVHGNNLFAGWTVPVPLFPSQYTLPPACVLIEGYGEVKTASYTVVPPPGHRILREENYLDAFVTFLHQSTKYSGPGTDGYLIRDSLITIFSPVSATSK